jgi:putative membrane protein
MKRKSVVLLGTAALCLSACGSKKDTAVPAPDASTNVAAVRTTTSALAPGQAFANKAASSDVFEIETSKLALDKSGSAKVKKFAQAMIIAHTDSTAKLKAAAGSSSAALVPDPTLAAEQQAKLDALKAASGVAFDTAYIDEQRGAHEATLAALRDYSASGDVPALKSFATTLVPTVAAHLNMAKGLKP